MFRNKRFLSLFVSLALVLGILLGATPESVFADDSKTITILHTNDVHGRVEADERDKAMGLAKFKTKVDEIREENPNTILLNAGDTIHGTLMVNITEGETMIDLMNLIGFDAMAPGNHDFNFGYKRLLELDEIADFPILAANVVNEETGERYFDSYTILEVDGINIGIFGLATEETPFKSHPDNTRGIEFTSPIEASREMVEVLKDQGADIVIALGHLGIEGTTTEKSIDVLENVEGIDLFVDGHSHEILNEEVGDALLVQAGQYIENIGRVDIEIEAGEIVDKKASLFTYEEAEDLEANPEIEETIEEIEKINKPIIETIIGETIVDLEGERGDVRTRETNLGNLIADVMLHSTDADIAMTNGGGIRATIEKGQMKMEDVLSAFPFTNNLAVIEATGAEIVEALERGVDLYPDEAGHFLQVSGMKYSFDPDKEVGSRIQEVFVGEEELDLEKTYKLATNDFMAAGGDGYTMFEGKEVIAQGALFSDILVDYMKEIGVVSPEVEGRILVVTGEEGVEEAFDQYTVQVNDVLWKIARKFNTTWERLAEINKLKNPHLIFPHQKLTVPALQ